MMLGWILLAVWCVSGIIAVFWLTRDEILTWGRLAFCICIGSVLGLLVFVTVGVKILTEAEFWSKPIFPRKGKK